MARAGFTFARARAAWRSVAGAAIVGKVLWPDVVPLWLVAWVVVAAFFFDRVLRLDRESPRA